MASKKGFSRSIVASTIASTTAIISGLGSWKGRCGPSNQRGERTRSKTSPTNASVAGRWPRAAWMRTQKRSKSAAFDTIPPWS